MSSNKDCLGIEIQNKKYRIKPFNVKMVTDDNKLTGDRVSSELLIFING